MLRRGCRVSDIHSLSMWSGLVVFAGLGEKEERAPEFLEHVVMPDDTLVGICLKYKVGETLGLRVAHVSAEQAFRWSSRSSRSNPLAHFSLCGLAAPLNIVAARHSPR